MKEVHINDADFSKQMEAVFLSNYPIAIVEFSGVYGLLAPNNKAGFNACNKVKARLGNKYYGSILSDFETLKTITDFDISFMNKEFLNTFQGAIIRIPVLNKFHNSLLVSKGTHQILIEDQNVQQKMLEFDHLVKQNKSIVDSYLYPYLGPICTSANISGDPSGGIKSAAKAISFARDRRIPLMVHTGLLTDNLGSYPVLSLTSNGYSIEREGPNTELICQKADLFYANFGE